MSKKEIYKQKNIQFLKDLSVEEGILSLPCGIYYKVLETGEGKSSPTPRSIVSVHYRGTLIDGKDSTIPTSVIAPKLSAFAMSSMVGKSHSNKCM